MPYGVATWWKFKRSLVKDNIVFRNVLFCFFLQNVFVQFQNWSLNPGKEKASTHGKRFLSPSPLAPQRTLRCKEHRCHWRKRRRLKKCRIFSTTGHHSWVPMLLKNLHWFRSHSSPNSWHWRMQRIWALGFRSSRFLQALRPVVLQVCLCLVAPKKRLMMHCHGWQKRRMHVTWFFLFIFQNFHYVIWIVSQKKQLVDTQWNSKAARLWKSLLAQRLKLWRHSSVAKLIWSCSIKVSSKTWSWRMKRPVYSIWKMLWIRLLVAW